jgi:putative transposase
MIKRLELIGYGKLWMVLYKGTSWGKTADRAKCGTKRSMVVDGITVPFGITVDANRHDKNMTKIRSQSMVIDRPEPTTRAKQHMSMDKGYDYPGAHEILEDYGYTIHIRLIGEYRVICKRTPRYRDRHSIAERIGLEDYLEPLSHLVISMIST